MKAIVALAGGVGAARFLEGLARLLPRHRTFIIGNLQIGIDMFNSLGKIAELVVFVSKSIAHERIIGFVLQQLFEGFQPRTGHYYFLLG